MIRALAVMMCLCLGIVAIAACGANFNADKAIAVVAREDDSGTKSAFMEIIGLKDKKDPIGAITQTSTDGALAEVKSNPQAIAYDSLGFVDSSVKMLTIDGVEPKGGSYKISRPLSIVCKESTILSGINKHFYDFLMSSDAQTIIADSGYASLCDDAIDCAKPANLSGTGYANAKNGLILNIDYTLCTVAKKSLR